MRRGSDAPCDVIQRGRFDRPESPKGKKRHEGDPLACHLLNKCVVLAVNEAYSDQDLEETVKAFERVVGYFQSKR